MYIFYLFWSKIVVVTLKLLGEIEVGFSHIFLDSIIGFLALFVITKVLGKSQITQITAFDFISALVLGELVGNALYDKETGIPHIIFAVTLWGVFIYVTEFLTQKWKKTRSLLEGKPSMIIHKGKVLKDEMKKARLDINQLQHLLRSKDAFSIQDVEYAILETDGSISVLKKTMMQNPTRKDFNLKPESVFLPITIISDGEVIWDNLKESKLNENWLKSELSKHNVTDYHEIMYAEWQKGEPLYVLPY